MGSLTATVLGDDPTSHLRDVHAGQGVRPTWRACLPGATRALPTPANGPAWYGEDLTFQMRLERGTAAALPGDLSCTIEEQSTFTTAARLLVYTHAGLDLPGRRDPVPVRIEFHQAPPYDTYGLDPRDYPRVFADPGAESEHRMPDDALCLYYPHDSEDRRWVAEDGLTALLDLVRNHLYYEMRWRDTGGHTGGVWLGNAAPHGFPRGESG